MTGHVAPDELFPLLTKLIDAHDVLSVQVHPDDRFARENCTNLRQDGVLVHRRRRGRAPTLIYGFGRDSNPDEYTRLVAEGTLGEILRPLRCSPGDVVYIPAGRVHAIGAGIMLYEMQQTSDVTYRIYDWNRRDAEGKPRELHVDKARRVLDYHRWTRGPVQDPERARQRAEHADRRAATSARSSSRRARPADAQHLRERGGDLRARPAGGDWAWHGRRDRDTARATRRC